MKFIMQRTYARFFGMMAAGVILLLLGGCGKPAGFDTVLDYANPPAARETTQRIGELSLAQRKQYEDAKFFIMAEKMMTGQWPFDPDAAEARYRAQFNGKTIREVIDEAERRRAVLNAVDQKLSAPAASSENAASPAKNSPF